MANEEIEKITIRAEIKPDEASAARSGDAISKALSKSLNQLSQSIDEMSKRMERTVSTSTSAMTKGMDAQFKTLAKALEDSLSKGLEKGMSKAGLATKEHVRRIKKDVEEVAKAADGIAIKEKVVPVKVVKKGTDIVATPEGLEPVTRKDVRNHTYKAQAEEMRTKWGEAAVASTGAYEELLSKGAHAETMDAFRKLLKIMALNDKELKQGFLSVQEQMRRAELSTAVIQFRDKIGGFGKEFKKGIPPANWGVEQFEAANKKFPKWDVLYKKYEAMLQQQADQEKRWAFERHAEEKLVASVNRRIGIDDRGEPTKKYARRSEEQEERERADRMAQAQGRRVRPGNATDEVLGLLSRIPGMNVVSNLVGEGLQKGYFSDIAGMFGGGANKGEMKQERPGKGLLGDLFGAFKGPMGGTSMGGAAPKGGATAGAGAGAGGAAGGAAAAAVPVAALLFIAKGIMDVLEKIFQTLVKSSGWMEAVVGLLELGILHVIRPMADAIGQWLMPYVMKFADASLSLYKQYTPKNGESFDVGGYMGAVAKLGVATIGEFTFDTYSYLVETLANIIIDVQAWIIKSIIDVAGWILVGLVTVQEFIVNGFLEGLRWLGLSITAVIHGVIDSILGIWFGIGDILVKIAEELTFNKFDSSDYYDMKNKVYGTVDNFFGGVEDWWNGVIDTAQESVTSIATTIKTTINDGVNEAKTLIDTGVGLMKDAIATGFDDSRNLIGEFTDWMVSDLRDGSHASISFTETEVDGMDKTHKKALDVIDGINVALDDSMTSLTGGLNGLSESATTAVANLTALDQEMLDTVGHISFYSHNTDEETGDSYRGYATGGIAWTPQIARVAENEPELITPLSQLKQAFGGSTQSSGATIVFNHYGNIFGVDDLDAYYDKKMREYDMRAW